MLISRSHELNTVWLRGLMHLLLHVQVFNKHRESSSTASLPSASATCAPPALKCFKFLSEKLSQSASRDITNLCINSQPDRAVHQQAALHTTRRRCDGFLEQMTCIVSTAGSTGRGSVGCTSVTSLRGKSLFRLWLADSRTEESTDPKPPDESISQNE